MSLVPVFMNDRVGEERKKRCADKVLSRSGLLQVMEIMIENHSL